MFVCFVVCFNEGFCVALSVFVCVVINLFVCFIVCFNEGFCVATHTEATENPPLKQTTKQTNKLITTQTNTSKASVQEHVSMATNT